jgi:hypothetical protein
MQTVTVAPQTILEAFLPNRYNRLRVTGTGQISVNVIPPGLVADRYREIEIINDEEEAITVNFMGRFGRSVRLNPGRTVIGEWESEWEDEYNYDAFWNGIEVYN